MLALRRSFLVLLAAVGLAGLAAGCATKPRPVNTVEPQVRTGIPVTIPDRRVFCDPELHTVIDVGDVNIDTTPENLLKVQLRLTNLTTSFQSVEYRYDWTDDHGMQFSAPTSRWMLLKLKPKDSVLVVGVAPNPAVKDFIFKANTRR